MNSTLRDLWTSDDATLGGWCSIPSPVSAEVMSRLGFDWLCVDAQHGLMGYEQMVTMIQAIAISGTPSLVRVAWNDAGLISRALDAGASGVIIPMINSPEEAKRAVAACRYPPMGHRSWGPIRSQLSDPRFTPEDGNRQTVCVVMIETREAVDQIDSILSVPGIDGVYVGPMDLSVSYGLEPGGLLSDPAHHAVFELIASSCMKHGVVAGSHCPDSATAKWFREIGYRMLNVAGDIRFLRQAAEVVIHDVLGAASGQAGGAGYG